MIEVAAERSGYLAELQSERTIEAEGRIENLRELGGVAAEFESRVPDGTLADFLESIALVGEGLVYQITLGAQLGLLLAAAFGVGIARYYVLVTWATVVSLVRYLRFGVPAVWAKAEGTR